MVLYKSLCRSPKTFYGVTFKYGDIHPVSGFIHDPRFVCLSTNYRPSTVVTSNDLSITSDNLSISTVATSEILAATAEDTKEIVPDCCSENADNKDDKLETKKSESKKSNKSSGSKSAKSSQ